MGVDIQKVSERQWPVGQKIYLLVEHREGAITADSLALSGVARRLAEKTGRPAALLLLGCDIRPLAEELAKRTGLDVFCLEHPALKENHAEACGRVLSAWLAEHPFLALPTASVNIH